MEEKILGLINGNSPEVAAKEITLLMLEEKEKAYEEARIIVMKDGDIDFAEHKLYLKISEINQEIDSIKKL